MIDLGITSALLDGNGHEASITIVNVLVYETDATTVSTGNASTNHPSGERGWQTCEEPGLQSSSRSIITCMCHGRYNATLHVYRNVCLHVLTHTMLYCISPATESNFPNWCNAACSLSFSYTYLFTQLGGLSMNGDTHAQLCTSPLDLRPLNTSRLCFV